MKRLKGMKMFACVMACVCAIAFIPVSGVVLSASAEEQAGAAVKETAAASEQVAATSGIKLSTMQVVVKKGSKVKVTANKTVSWKTIDKSISTCSKGKAKTVYIKGKKEGQTTVKVYKGKDVVYLSVSVYDNNSVTGNYRAESYISGVLYQESAEVAAQYKQVFELAKIRLDEAIKNNKGTGKGLAIVTDIDATLMDDSCYFAGALTDTKGRAALGLEPWNNDDWCGYYAAVATDQDIAVPGAVEFINYAYSKGVEIYYITNRPYYELDLTVQQLKHANFAVDDIVKDYAALADKDNRLQEYHYWADATLPDGSDYNKEVLDYKAEVIDNSDFEMQTGSFSLKGDYRVQVQGSEFSSDKAARRANVANKVAAEGGKIIMYMGDSINDMISKNEYKHNPGAGYTQEQSIQFDRSVGNEARTAAVMNDTWKDKWGTEFIVMPNSAYGDWQKATWNKKSISRTEQNAYTAAQLARHSYLNAYTWYTGPSPIGPEIQ